MTDPWPLVLDRLRDHDCRPWERGASATARCPAHDDSSPSLSLHWTGSRVLLTCHAGCPTLDVLHALELGWADLLDDSTRRATPTRHRYDQRRRPARKRSTRPETFPAPYDRPPRPDDTAATISADLGHSCDGCPRPDDTYPEEDPDRERRRLLVAELARRQLTEPVPVSHVLRLLSRPAAPESIAELESIAAEQVTRRREEERPW